MDDGKRADFDRQFAVAPSKPTRADTAIKTGRNTFFGARGAVGARRRGTLDNVAFTLGTGEAGGALAQKLYNIVQACSAHSARRRHARIDTLFAASSDEL